MDTGSRSAKSLAWAGWAQGLYVIVFAGFMLSIAVAPFKLIFAACICLSALVLCHTLLRAAACLSSARRFTAYNGTNYTDETPYKSMFWPAYTVLIPLKDEAHMLPLIISAMSKLDYPRDRLQILLITEESDPATTQAANAFAEPPFYTVIVPRGGPKTKPNALNYAMKIATGTLITIYDAEDHPHPQQLKTSARAMAANPHWGALQAPLDYFNGDETKLARQFAIEYAALFHVWVPFLARLGLPFPLGGTSNHMRGLM